MPLMKTCPGVEVVDEPLLLGRVVGPGVGAEAERRAVGQLDRLVDVGGTEQRGDRAEHLLGVHRACPR